MRLVKRTKGKVHRQVSTTQRRFARLEGAFCPSACAERPRRRTWRTQCPSEPATYAGVTLTLTDVPQAGKTLEQIKRG
jgi:hypothetical protein